MHRVNTNNFCKVFDDFLQKKNYELITKDKIYTALSNIDRLFTNNYSISYDKPITNFTKLNIAYGRTCSGYIIDLSHYYISPVGEELYAFWQYIKELITPDQHEIFELNIVKTMIYLNSYIDLLKSQGLLYS